MTRRAESDLVNIGAYTIKEWGEAQASRYLHEIEALCQRLAENPDSGRSCDYVRRGLRRLEHGKHVVFYRRIAGDILVSRFLHQNMLATRHAMDDPDDAG